MRPVGEVPRVFGTDSNGRRLGGNSLRRRVAGRWRQPEAEQGGGVEGERRKLGARHGRRRLGCGTEEARAGGSEKEERELVETLTSIVVFFITTAGVGEETSGEAAYQPQLARLQLRGSGAPGTAICGRRGDP
jgi:hypothetical protein